jgi:hypothetical protein
MSVRVQLERYMVAFLIGYRYVCGLSGEGRPRDDGDVMRPGSAPLILCAFRLYTGSQPHDTCQNRALE